MTDASSPLRLRIDGSALVSNYRWLAGQSAGAACGAAVKADGYGVGANQVALRLANAGCRDFFVATWAEAEGLDWLGGNMTSVLHGVTPETIRAALASTARPVLNTPAQARLWRTAAPGRPCDVMVDTGMNRLGLSAQHIADGAIDGLAIETLMSHLACADEDSPMNARQLDAFTSIARGVEARRLSLANSAGICLGPSFAFDLTRPGLALYGGVPRAEAEGHIAQVAHVEAQVVQRRRIGPGDTVGYNATFTSTAEMEIAILNIGYADGYLRGFSGRGEALWRGEFLPVIGRVSMDLTAVSVDAAPNLSEGDWVEVDYDLPRASTQSGLSQYELLTGLGDRYDRFWI